MTDHVHTFVWVGTDAGKIVQRCACGKPGPAGPFVPRKARKLRDRRREK